MRPTFRPHLSFSLGACLWVAALLALPTPADAHIVQPLNTTGFAAAEGVGSGQNLRLVPLTNGAAVSLDNGGHYAWLCEEALVGPLVDDAVVGITAAGSLLLGDANVGLLHSTDRGCTWRRSGTFDAEHALADLVVTPAFGNDAWVVASNAVADGHGSLWRTVDGGRQYLRLGFAQKNVYLTGITASGTHLVATGTNNRAKNSTQVFFSRDAGATFQPAATHGAPDVTGDVRAFALEGNAVAVAVLDATTNGAVVLLGKDLAGPYWPIYHSFEPIRGVASTGGGQQLIVAGSDHLAISLDGGGHFRQARRPEHNACVGRTGGQLYVCGSSEDDDGFNVAQLTLQADQPQFKAQLRFDALRGPYHCPEGTPVADRCLPQWEQAAQRFGTSAAPPSATELAALRAEAGKASHGCSCSAGKPANESSQAVAVLLAGHALWALQRRRLRRRGAMVRAVRKSRRG